MKMVDRVKAAAAALRGKGFYLSRTADLNVTCKARLCILPASKF